MRAWIYPLLLDTSNPCCYSPVEGSKLAKDIAKFVQFVGGDGELIHWRRSCPLYPLFVVKNDCQESWWEVVGEGLLVSQLAFPKTSLLSWVTLPKWVTILHVPFIFPSSSYPKTKWDCIICACWCQSSSQEPTLRLRLGIDYKSTCSFWKSWGVSVFHSRFPRTLCPKGPDRVEGTGAC